MNPRAPKALAGFVVELATPVYGEHVAESDEIFCKESTRSIGYVLPLYRGDAVPSVRVRWRGRRRHDGANNSNSVADMGCDH